MFQRFMYYRWTDAVDAMRATCILVLLSISGLNAWNMEYIYGLLSPLGSMMGFQELVWFISKQLKTEHVEPLDRFIRMLDEKYAVTQTVITNNTQMRMVRAPARRNHASILFTTGINDPIMEVFRHVLVGRHFYFSVVILVDKVSDLKPMLDVCDFLIDYQYLNTLMHFQSVNGINQLYGGTKYPHSQCRNLTDFLRHLRARQKDIVSTNIDVEGLAFLTPLRQDLPHVVKLESNRKIKRYEGSTYHILDTFVKYLNGSFQNLKMSRDSHGGEVVNMKEVLQLVRERQVEFTPHAYALFNADEEVDKSYPLLVVKWCLMVPLYNRVSTYLYSVQPFDWLVWTSMIASLILLILLDLLWIRLFGTAGVGGSIHNAVLNSFSYILNISAVRPLYKPCLLRFLLLAAVFFHGFFLSTNYTSTLGSIMTVNLFHAQLNTMDDLVRAQLPVMIIDYELDFLLSVNNELPEEFRKLLGPVDAATFAEHQTKFNSSYAYFVTEDHWNFLDEQQNHLKQRRFKLSNICFGSYHLAYPIQMDSYLWRSLEYYTFRVHSSGLLSYYERTVFQTALHAGFVERFQENKEFTSAGLEHLAMAFVLLIVMCIFSGIVFLIELFYAPYLRSREDV